MALILGWELFSRSYEQLQFVLPAPSSILKCCWERSDRLLMHTLVTLKEIGGGFFLALFISFPLAWGMYRYYSLRVILQPLFVIVQCIPMFALAPIMVLWFGWSYVSIIIPTTLMIFFPLTINIYQGLCSTPAHLMDYFRVHQATAWQIFWKLQLPWSVPNLIAGFRIAAAIAGFCAVAGEWAGGQAGLGLLMIESRRGVDLEMTFAALFCLTLISLSIYGTSILIENRLTRHRKKTAARAGTATAALASFCAILLGSCQSSADPTAKETTMILDWLPNPNHVPIYAGIEKEIFQKHGIHLKLLKLHDPGDGISMLSTGHVDLAVYYMPETYVANSQGANLMPVGFLVKQPLNAFIFRSGENIHKPGDLNGKNLGYVVGDFGLGMLKQMLAGKNIIPSNIYNVNFDLVSTIGTKRVDVIFGAYWNIEVEHLRSLGIESDFFSLADFGCPNYCELLIVARRGTPCASPDFVSRFKAAMQESIDYSAGYPDEAFESYVKANPDKSDITFIWEREAWRRTYPILASDQEDDPGLWEAFANWVKQE